MGKDIRGHIMKNTELLNYECEVQATVYKHGKIINQFSKSNLLTNMGKLIILSRLCGVNPPESNLNQMVFGDSTYEPTVLDVLDDFGNFYINSTLGHKLNLITEDSVEVYWELLESEFNGRVVKCVGLTSDDLVFNRVLFNEADYIDKDPSVKIVGKWVIKIVQS